jgi:hypothetical protein
MSPVNQYEELTNELQVRIINSKVFLSIARKNIVDVKEFVKIVEEFKPDIIHSHLFWSELMSRHVIFPGVKYVTHCHDNMVELNKFTIKTLFSKASFTKYFERLWIMSKYKKCNNHFIAISRDTQQYLNHILSLTSQDASHLRTLRETIRNNNNDCVLYQRIKYEHAAYGNSSRPYGVTYKDFTFKYNVKKDYIEDGENVWHARDLYSIKEDYIESFEAIKKYNIYHEDSILGQINSELTMDEELFEGAVNLIQNNEVSNHKLLMESMCNFNFKASAPYLLWLTHLGAAKMYASGMKDNINFKSFLSYFNINLTKHTRRGKYVEFKLDDIINSLDYVGLLTTTNFRIIEKLLLANVDDHLNDIKSCVYIEGVVIADNTFTKTIVNTLGLDRMIQRNEAALLNPVIEEEPIIEQDLAVEKQQPLNNMENMPKTAQELEQEFYAKPFLMSYSGLNKLLYSPKMFYNHYILKQREDRTDTHLIDGKVIHSLLLNDGSFDENFILLPASLPSDNTRKIIDKVNEHFLTLSEEEQTKDDALLLGTYSDIILKSLKEINLHQSLKTDEQRLAKIITEETITYFQFLRIKGRRDIIDTETLKRCNESIDFLKADSRVCDLLGLYKSETENTDVFNEIELSSDAVGIDKIGLKGFADNIKINHDNKVIFINDLKTTGKTITDFSETVKFYNYHIQAAIYTRLVKEVYKHIITPEWSVIFNFIVIDKYNQVYAFEVSTTSLAAWDEELQKKLIEADWHYKNNNYNLPYSFATGLVML